jgi:hypothetical protein
VRVAREGTGGLTKAVQSAVDTKLVREATVQRAGGLCLVVRKQVVAAGSLVWPGRVKRSFVVWLYS